MKKFLLGAIAVAALASCSNDDVVDVNKGEASLSVPLWIRR